MIKPHIGERIYDGAVGSAGFLCESFDYLKDLCKSPEEFKAWSQNLGHEKVLTTFMSYGAVACDRQGDILRGLASQQQPVQSGANEIAEALFQKFRDFGLDVQVK
jgi:hypothetical protein